MTDFNDPSNAPERPADHRLRPDGSHPQPLLISGCRPSQKGLGFGEGGGLVRDLVGRCKGSHVNSSPRPEEEPLDAVARQFAGVYWGRCRQMVSYIGLGSRGADDIEAERQLSSRNGGRQMLKLSAWTRTLI